MDQILFSKPSEAYFNNIIVSSNTLGQHIQDLREVFLVLH